MARPPKRPDLLMAIRSAAHSGDYILTEHAKLRMAQRKITLPEVLQLLVVGRHEAAKDEFVEQVQAWNYAVRGRTVDGRELRVAVGFDAMLMVITVIDLDAGGKHGN